MPTVECVSASPAIFISYRSTDKAWAELIAWQLERANYRVIIQSWDFTSAKSFVGQMDDALAKGARLLAVLSPAYFTSDYTNAEWRAAFAADPSGREGRICCVRVVEFKVPGLLAAYPYVDLFGVDPDEVHRRLLAHVDLSRRKPQGEPPLPPSAKTVPHSSSLGPDVKKVRQIRNRHFTGRDAELTLIAARLAQGASVALVGMSGVGKTQLAIEFAWQHGHEYQAIVWLNAKTSGSLNSSAALHAGPRHLDLAALDSAPESDCAEAVFAWLRDNPGWLLVCDDAEDEQAAVALRERLPIGDGHLIITSSCDCWDDFADKVGVHSWTTESGVAFLEKRLKAEAGRLADAEALVRQLGGFPLALNQAAAFLSETRLRCADYLAALRSNRATLLNRRVADATNNQSSVAEAWALSVARATPIARAALRVAAWLAPEPVPRALFAADPAVILEAADGVGEAEPDSEALPAGLQIQVALGALGKFSLAEVDGDICSVHRLVQALEQDATASADRAIWLGRAIRLSRAALADTDPMEAEDWPRWAALAPHFATILDHALTHPVPTAEIVWLLNRFACYRRARGDFGTARALADRALHLIENASEGNEEELAYALNNFGLLLLEVEGPDTAEPFLARAAALHQRIHCPDHPAVASDYSYLAALHRIAGRFSQAESFYRRAIEIFELSGRDAHPGYPTALHNLAYFLRETDRFAEAEALFRRALENFERQLGPAHPSVAAGCINLGHLLRESGRFAEAEPLLRRALSLQKSALGEDHPDVAAGCSALGQLLLAVGRRAEAEPLLRRALEIDGQSYGPNDRRTEADVCHLAHLLTEEGRLDEAGGLFDRLLANADESQWITGYFRFRHAQMLNRAGRHDEAATERQHAIEIVETALGPGHRHATEIRAWHCSAGSNSGAQNREFKGA